MSNRTTLVDNNTWYISLFKLGTTPILQLLEKRCRVTKKKAMRLCGATMSIMSSSFLEALLAILVMISINSYG
jgi:hypothetical protein